MFKTKSSNQILLRWATHMISTSQPWSHYNSKQIVKARSLLTSLQCTMTPSHRSPCRQRCPQPCSPPSKKISVASRTVLNLILRPLSTVRTILTSHSLRSRNKSTDKRKSHSSTLIRYPTSFNSLPVSSSKVGLNSGTWLDLARCLMLSTLEPRAWSFGLTMAKVSRWLSLRSNRWTKDSSSNSIQVSRSSWSSIPWKTTVSVSTNKSASTNSCQIKSSLCVTTGWFCGRRNPSKTASSRLY